MLKSVDTYPPFALTEANRKTLPFCSGISLEGCWTKSHFRDGVSHSPHSWHHPPVNSKPSPALLAFRFEDHLNVEVVDVQFVYLAASLEKMKKKRQKYLNKIEKARIKFEKRKAENKRQKASFWKRSSFSRGLVSFG